MSSTVTVEPSDSLGNPTVVVSEPLLVEEPVVVEEPLPAPKRSWFQASVPTLLFIGRRLLSSLIVLLGATFILYMMLALSLDFLEDLRASTDPNAPALIEQRIALLNLDTPPIGRYFMWLAGLFTGNGMGTTWGQAFGQTSVWGLLMTRIPATLSLVFAASILSILLGILVGIVSALRQYTRFDYSVTFLSFVLFSLPSFWVAVLLKTWGAIGFNDFFENPHFPWWAMIVIPLVAGIIWSAIIGGNRRTRWISFIVSALVTVLLMLVLTQTQWMQNPVLGIPGILVLGLAAAVALTSAFVGIQPASRAVLTDDVEAAISGDVLADADTTKAGFGSWLSANRALAAAITTALVGAALYIPLQFLFVTSGWLQIFLLALVALAVGALIGWLWGGYDRRISMRISALTALLQGIFIFIDRVLQTWWHYNRAPQINFRPIATINANTPGIANFFNNNFWFMNLDRFTHVLLPTMTLLLISFAGYTRYTRGSMLEVMNQDYIRTARAKGLPERVVTLRHAFRNALIPLATIIPLDLAGLLGGAIITEQIFGWPGMGQLFIQALNGREVEVIMGHFLVTGTLLVIGTIVVDFLYAALDPRIRVDA